MSDTIDNRVVSVEFDNNAFDSRVQGTIKSLDALKKSLDFAASQRGLDGLSNSAKNFNISGLDGIASSVSNIAHRFTLLGIVGATALVGLTTSVAHFATNMARQDVLGPIITGGTARAKNIQQAQFMFEGLGIDVQKGMASALAAVKGTAFGLDEAAKAAAQFGAAGIQVGGDMTAALRGVAGAAALTGTSFSEMAQIFEGSAGTGIVNNQDLGQFATRGLNAAAAVGKVMGKTEAQIHQMAASGKLDFKTFAAAMDKAFGAHATQANEIFTGALANMHAALSRLGASFIGPKLVQERDILNSMSPAIDAFNKSIQPVFKAFLAIGQLGTNRLVGFFNGLNFTKITPGMNAIASGVLRIYFALSSLGKVAKDAFRLVFPSTSAAGTFNTLAKAFEHFTEKLKMGGETASKIRDIFSGVFSAFHIGFILLRDVGRVIGNVFRAISPVGGGFLDLAAAVGHAITNFDLIISSGGSFQEFLDTLGVNIQKPIQFIDKLRDSVVGFFKGLHAPDASGFQKFLGSLFNGLHLPNLDGIRKAISGFFDIFKKNDSAHLSNSLDGGFKRVGDRLNWLGNVFSHVGKLFHWFGHELLVLAHGASVGLHDFVDWVEKLGPAISKGLKSDQLKGILSIINTISLALGAKGFKDISKNGLSINFGFFSDLKNVMQGLQGTFKAFQQNLKTLKGTLKSMQTEVRSKALLNIAIALGVLTASILVLSFIDPDALAKSMAAMAAGFTELVAAMTALDKLSSGAGGAAKVAAMAGGLVLLSGAMVLLAGAMKIFATMSWQDIAKGMASVAASLTAIALATKLMPSGPKMLGIGAGLIGIGISLNLIATSMKIFATLDLPGMAKGLVGVGGSLALIALAMKLMPSGPSMVGIGAGLVGVGISLNLIAASMKIFATMSLSELAKGLVGVGVALTLISLAMRLAPTNLPITAAGMVVLSVALNIMAVAVKQMGSIDFKTMVKGIAGLAAILLVLVVAMAAMEGALPGAIALVIVSGALLVLTKVMKEMAGLSWGNIAKGLLAIAAAIAIIGLSSILLEEFIPAMLGLGVAMGLVGVSAALFGVGAILVAKAFEIMAKSGAAGAKAIVAALKIILTALPDIVKALAQSLIDFGEGLLGNLPAIIKIIAQILDAIFNLIIKETPKLAKALAAIITAGLGLIRQKFPDILETGFEILDQLLTGMNNHLPDLVKKGSEIIVTFLNGLAAHTQEIADAGANLLIQFIIGVGTQADSIVTAGVTVLIKFIQGIEKNSIRLVNAAFQTILDFINGLTDAINKYSPQIRDASLRLGFAIINGISGGMLAKIGDVSKFVGGIGASVLHWMGDVTGTLIKPGVQFISGLFVGLRSRMAVVWQWVGTLAGKFVGFIKDPLHILESVGDKIIHGLWNGMQTAWKKVTGWLSSLNPASHFNDINVELHHAEKNMYPAGAATMGGLLSGMKQGWSGVTVWLSSLDPSSELQTDRFKKLQETFRNLPKSLAEMEEFKPTITPVLDLTTVQQQAKSLRTLDVSAGVSLKDARLISATASVGSSGTDVVEPSGPSSVVFNQTNNSPTPLTTDKIYRGTKSQISLAKKELNIP